MKKESLNPEIEHVFDKKIKEVSKLMKKAYGIYSGPLGSIFMDYNFDMYVKLKKFIRFHDIDDLISSGKKYLSSYETSNFEFLVDLILNDLKQGIMFVVTNKQKYINLRPDMKRVAENYLNDYIDSLKELKEKIEDIKKLRKR